MSSLPPKSGSKNFTTAQKKRRKEWTEKQRHNKTETHTKTEKMSM